MEIIKLINYIIAVLFFVCYSYQFIYMAIPWFKKAPVKKAAKAHDFAVLICARNEQSVIANLINSINNQDYTLGTITVFVIADNCTDLTAEIAEKAGAFVFTRTNTELVGKGYALDELIKNILANYPDSFDAYFVFDADNVLEKNYFTEMNRVFSDGYDIVTSYRNTKNYGDNWISAGYGLWFLRESSYLNAPRMLLNTSCAVSGTGFMFSHKIVNENGGWPFHLLTEDIEFTVHSILSGITIGYARNAVLYDEQPVLFSQSCRQRLRWAKGYLQVFRKYGFNLIKGIFKMRFSCFDMAMSIMPAAILTFFSIIINFFALFFGILTGGIPDVLCSIVQTIVNMYLTLWFIGMITTISEWKQIHTKTTLKILYSFTFPLFMFTYIPISFAAIFIKVRWAPIRHTRSMDLTDICK